MAFRQTFDESISMDRPVGVLSKVSNHSPNTKQESSLGKKRSRLGYETASCK